MSKLPFIATAATALLIFVGGPNALAECNLEQGLGLASQTQYQGYSTKPAKELGAPGNSTVVTSVTTWNLKCTTENPDGSTSINFIPQYTITEQNYTHGPGNSPFMKKNPSPTCAEAATGTISCPF